LGPFTVSAVVALMTAFGGLPAAAVSDFPNRPLTLIVPAPTGGGQDIEGRLFAGVAEKYLGQPVEVENVIGGANNSLGTAKVAAARPDGYTWVIAASDSITIEPNRSHVPYSYKSFTPVAQIDKVTIVLAAGPHSPVKSAAALKTYARQHPNDLTVGVAGIGGSPHLAVARIFQALGGVPVRYIPYQGSGQALAAALGGTVDLMIGSPSSIFPSAQARKIYPLFVSSPDPISSMPGVPGAKALGVPGAAMVLWRVIFVPVQTPSDIVQTLNAAFAKALADPDYNTKLSAVGGEGGPNTDIPSLEKMITSENATMGGLLRTVFIGQQ
jgi:tripartite-type tricarboxylate transporter receptor subunit TctC